MYMCVCNVCVYVYVYVYVYVRCVAGAVIMYIGPLLLLMFQKKQKHQHVFFCTQ